jgi:hypothetical protein
MRNEDNKSLLEAFCGVIYSAGGGGGGKNYGGFPTQHNSSLSFEQRCQQSTVPVLMFNVTVIFSIAEVFFSALEGVLSFRKISRTAVQLQSSASERFPEQYSTVSVVSY